MQSTKQHKQTKESPNMAQRRSSFMGLLVFLCFCISFSNAQRMFLDSYQNRALQVSRLNGMVGQNSIGVNWVGGQGSGYGSGSGSGSGSGNGVGSGSGTGTGAGTGTGTGTDTGSGGQGSTGYGSGTGSGRGYGSGSGNGNGNGYGSGSGSGSGSGEPGYGYPPCEGAPVYIPQPGAPGYIPQPGTGNPGYNPGTGCGCQPASGCGQCGYGTLQGNKPTNNMGRKTSNEDSKVKPPPKAGGSDEPVPPPAMHEYSWSIPPRRVDGFNPQGIQALNDDEPPPKEHTDGLNAQIPPGKEKVDGLNPLGIQAQGSTRQLHH